MLFSTIITPATKKPFSKASLKRVTEGGDVSLEWIAEQVKTGERLDSFPASLKKVGW